MGVRVWDAAEGKLERLPLCGSKLLDQIKLSYVFSVAQGYVFLCLLSFIVLIAWLAVIDEV